MQQTGWYWLSDITVVVVTGMEETEKACQLCVCVLLLFLTLKGTVSLHITVVGTQTHSVLSSTDPSLGRPGSPSPVLAPRYLSPSTKEGRHVQSISLKITSLNRTFSYCHRFSWNRTTPFKVIKHFNQPYLSQVEDLQLLNITVTYNQQICCKTTGDIKRNLLYILKHRGSLYYLPSHQ